MTAVGIDVGKANLDLVVDGQPGVSRLPNTPAGISKVIKRLKPMGAVRIVVEATGDYEEPLLEACCDAGLWIARVNPRQARNFARATGELAKTDAIDARLLALMARLFADRRRRHVAPPPWQRELRDWLRRRGQVVTLLQAQKQQAAMTSQEGCAVCLGPDRCRGSWAPRLPASRSVVRKLAARTRCPSSGSNANVEQGTRSRVSGHASSRTTACDPSV